MKKTITFFYCIVCMQTAFAQIKNIDSLRSVLAKTTNPVERFNLLNEILITTDGYKATKIDSASCIEILKLAQEQQDDAMLATSYNWIGYYFYQSRGDNTTALQYYFKGLPLSEKVKDKRRISSLCFDIANIYNTLQNFTEAFKYAQRGGKNLPDQSSPMYNYMLVQYQRGVCEYYLNTLQLDSASYYSQAMLQTSRKVPNTLFRYHALSLNADINSKMGEKEIAEVYFQKALAMSDSVKNNVSTTTFYKRYINFLFKNNRVKDAEKPAAELWAIASQTDNNNVRFKAAEIKRQLFEKLNQTDSAYFYSRMEAQLNNLIFAQNNQNALQALAFNEQIRLMEEDSKKEAADDQRNQNIQFVLIALAIISLIVIFLLLSRSFITNARIIEYFGVIALLIVFEFLNLLLHPFLEKITNHSPVLMLLALVCIAALLVPMHHKVEKWATKKLVEKNKMIRLAAARKTIEQLENNKIQ